MSILGYDATLRHGQKTRGGEAGSTPVRGGAPVCAGESQAVVARALDVTPMTACRCIRPGRGRAARAGRRPAAWAASRVWITGSWRGSIWRSAAARMAHGFATDLWTLPRIAEVIERQTGQRFHPGHVWRILRRQHWSLQRPARQAVERDEDAIRRWVQVRWSAVKKMGLFRLSCGSETQILEARGRGIPARETGPGRGCGG
jgi:transposase